MQCRGLLIQLVVLAALTLSAEARLPYPTHFEPEAGRTFVFIGDETTWQGHYTQYVEDFFYTRYPQKKVRFLNCGLKNDSTDDVLARLESDVLPLKPYHVLIMLGTWDGGFEDLEPDRFAQWQNDMTTLLDRLDRAGAHCILVSPPMFDRLTRDRRMEDSSYRFRSKAISPRYNGVMAYYGAWLRELAVERELRFADAWSPLNEHTSLERRLNPDFSLMQDSVHPDETGSVTIAASIAEALNPEHRTLGRLVLTQASSGWSSQVSRGKIRELVGATASVGYIWEAPTLPWVLPGVASFGVEMTDLNARFNEEWLQVSGMPAGEYHVYMNDLQASLTPFTAEDLALGVALHDLENRPQVHRARAVADLNAHRHEQVIQPWRDLWQQVKRVQVNFPNDSARWKAKLSELKPGMDALLKKAREQEDQIHAMSQPLPVRVQIMTREAWLARPKEPEPEEEETPEEENSAN